mgnify:CR=1 FL=1
MSDGPASTTLAALAQSDGDVPSTLATTLAIAGGAVLASASYEVGRGFVRRLCEGDDEREPGWCR